MKLIKLWLLITVVSLMAWTYTLHFKKCHLHYAGTAYLVKVGHVFELHHGGRFPSDDWTLNKFKDLQQAFSFAKLKKHFEVVRLQSDESIEYAWKETVMDQFRVYWVDFHKVLFRHTFDRESDADQFLYGIRKGHLAKSPVGYAIRLKTM